MSSHFQSSSASLFYLVCLFLTPDWVETEFFSRFSLCALALLFYQPALPLSSNNKHRKLLSLVRTNSTSEKKSTTGLNGQPHTNGLSSVRCKTSVGRDEMSVQLFARLECIVIDGTGVATLASVKIAHVTSWGIEDLTAKLKQSSVQNYKWESAKREEKKRCQCAKLQLFLYVDAAV